jgi:hypothetical protein
VQLQELRLLLSRDLDVNMAPLLPAALAAGELELRLRGLWNHLAGDVIIYI